MNRQAIALARKAAGEARAMKRRTSWESQPIASLALVRAVNRPRRILRPIY
jgi:hypothetical protein